MKQEEAIAILQEKHDECKAFYDLAAHPEEAYPGVKEYMEALQMALAALRGPTRERVEAWGGEWIKRHKHHGGFRRVKGIDDIGEQHEVTIDERCEYDDLYCTKCGKQSPDNFLNFCGYCGRPMTDEAVEIILRRLEALKDGSTD